MTRLEQLSALGQSVWIDFLSRDLIESGGLARAIEEDAVVGVTSNPSIFGKALSRGSAYDAQIASSVRRSQQRLPRLGNARRRRGLRCVAAGLGADQRPRRVRLDRGRPEPRGRHGRLDRPGDPLPRDDRPSEPAREDPGDRRGRSCDRGDDRPRIFDQRHVDLLARTATGKSPRPTCADLERLHRCRRRPGPSSFGRELLRVARRHRDRPSPRRSRTRRSPRPAGDRQRQARLPAIQGAVLRRALAGTGGPRCDQAALPVGVDLDEGPQLPRHALCRRADRPRDDHDDARGDDRRLSRSRPRRTAGSRRNSRPREQVFRELYAAGIDYDDIVATLEREGIEKFDAAFNDLLEGIARQARSCARRRPKSRRRQERGSLDREPRARAASSIRCRARR